MIHGQVGRLVGGMATLLVCVGMPAWTMAKNPVSFSNSEKVSEFGKYEGYSEPQYSAWEVTSQYVPMRDGVRLAVDVVRPTVDGKPVEKRLPVVWTHSRYHRSPQAMSPLTRTMVDAYPDLQRLVQHGYVVAAVGVRGSGASFGRYEGLFSPNETKDAYEIIDWLSKQPWSNGKIGMYGASYLGMTQYMAASQQHPALKAIFPNVAGFDLYDLIRPGGVYRNDMIEHWGQLTRSLDTQLKAPPVTKDQDQQLLSKAIAEHQNNWNVVEQYRLNKFRDTVLPEHSFETHNPRPFLKQINQARVPAYHWNGFLDIFVNDATIWYANYAGPQKLGIGPWPHALTNDRRYLQERFRLKGIEQHRWFDYWLKGIDNGVADEPPIHYATLVEPDQWTWHAARQWPPKSAQPQTFYLLAGKSGSIESVNDGQLGSTAPTEKGNDTYQVDQSTTTGQATRWDNAVGAGQLDYGDLTANDRKCLTYTSPKLDKDLTVTGHPVVRLFIDCSASDCDFFVVLEEVDEQGKSHYVTEGVLRASHRQAIQPGFNNLSLPYQRSNQGDPQPLQAGEVVELPMDLHPTSVVFNQGHRIRVSIMCADKDNAELLEESAGATINLHRSPGRASAIVLPVVEEE